jgi:ligand-binding sensor domain-containing protein
MRLHQLMKPVGLLCAVVGLFLAWGQGSTLLSQPAVTSFVLELDGKDGYVELPASAFTNLTKATIEGWVKWKRFAKGKSRVFDFGRANEKFLIGQDGGKSDLDFVFPDLPLDRTGEHLSVTVANVLRMNEWCHIAAVTGPGGLRLFFNGQLAASDTNFTRSLGSLSVTPSYYLGRSTSWGTSEFEGQMAEFRLWNVERSAEQIRDNLFAHLSGKEEGLVALWNFAGGSAHDASPGHHHGKLMGTAKVATAQLPGAAVLPHPALIYGLISDLTGKSHLQAKFRLEQNDSVIVEGPKAASDPRISRIYSAAVYGAIGIYQLSAIDGNFAAQQIGLELRAGESQRLDLILERKLSLTGHVLALDGKTPLSSVVVQVVKPAATKPVSQPPPGSRLKLADDRPIVDSVLSDGSGEFKFFNLKPGSYEVRCHVLGGLNYHKNAVRIDESSPSASRDAQSLDFRIAPFKKGTWRTFHTRDGLQHNIVFKIQPDAGTGMLWIAAAGAARFDGRDWLNLTVLNGLSDGWVDTMLRETNGVVWVGTRTGLTRWAPDTGKVANFYQRDGLLSDQVFSIAQGADGAIWVGTDRGVSQYVGNKFRNFTAADGLGAGTVLAIFAETNGVVWFGTGGGGVSRFDGNVFQTFTKGDGLVDNTASSILGDEDGTLWFGTPKGLSHFTGKEFVNFGQEDGLVLADDSLSCPVSKDAEGVLWFGRGNPNPTGGGVWRYDGKSFVHFGAEDGLPGESVLDIRSDSDGAIWFGCWGGLARYDPKTLVSFTEADGLADSAVHRMHVAPDHTLWLGGFNHGLTRYDHQRFLIPQGAEKLDFNGYGRVIRTDTAGILWLGTQSKGLYRFDGNQFFPINPFVGNAASVSDIEFNSDGTMWITAREGGVWRSDGTNLYNVSTNVGLSESTDLISGFKDDDGTLWLGATTTGLARYDGRQLKRFSNADGLPGSHILAISRDADGAHWFGVGGIGVCRYDGERFTTYTKENGQLSQSMVVGSFHDSAGVHWFAGDSGGGITRFDGAVWASFDDRDGLAHQDTFDVVEEPAGTFWIGTAHGLTRYQPKKGTPSSPRWRMKTTRGEFLESASIPPVLAGERVRFDLSVTDFKSRPDNRLYRYRVTAGGPPELRQLADANYRQQPGWSAAFKNAQIEWMTNEVGTYTIAFQFIDRDLNYSKPTLATLTVVPPWYLNAKIIGPIGVANLGARVDSTLARAAFGFRPTLECGQPTPS